ncbi:MAG: alpha/beta hydrolase family protein [Dehalococcoidia bacterium]
MEARIEAAYFEFLSEGLKLKVFMAKPEEKGRFPAVLVNHGGGGMDEVYEEMCIELAGTGYAALTMTFRGYVGSQGRQEYGKGEIEDLLNLVEYIKSQGFVDENRIGMFGYSRGALNTLLTCQRSEDFKAVVLWAAPVDMIAHHMLNPFIEDLIGGSPQKLAEEYRIRSPINFVERVTCPIFIIHGELDEVIPVKHAHMLARELERNNNYFEMKIYPGEGHVFTLETYRDAWKETVRFLNRYLL